MVSTMIGTGEKEYFHDRIVLLLLSISAFLTVFAVLSVLLRMQDNGAGYIVQYRATLGTHAFKPGSFSNILGFVVFSVVVLVTNTLLSLKTYRIHRQLSLLILSMSVLLLVLSIVVSNALLTLH